MALAFLAFALAIAINTCFQKIADPEDIACILDFSFTISHIVAVVIAAPFEFVWLVNHSYVFLVVAGMAMLCLVPALMMLRHPDTDHIALVNYPRAHLTGAGIGFRSATKTNRRGFPWISALRGRKATSPLKT